MHSLTIPVPLRDIHPISSLPASIPLPFTQSSLDDLLAALTQVYKKESSPAREMALDMMYTTLAADAASRGQKRALDSASTSSWDECDEPSELPWTVPTVPPTPVPASPSPEAETEAGDETQALLSQPSGTDSNSNDSDKENEAPSRVLPMPEPAEWVYPGPRRTTRPLPVPLEPQMPLTTPMLPPASGGSSYAVHPVPPPSPHPAFMTTPIQFPQAHVPKGKARSPPPVPPAPSPPSPPLRSWRFPRDPQPEPGHNRWNQPPMPVPGFTRIPAPPPATYIRPHAQQQPIRVTRRVPSSESLSARTATTSATKGSRSGSAASPAYSRTPLDTTDGRTVHVIRPRDRRPPSSIPSSASRPSTRSSNSSSSSSTSSSAASSSATSTAAEFLAALHRIQTSIDDLHLRFDDAVADLAERLDEHEAEVFDAGFQSGVNSERGSVLLLERKLEDLVGLVQRLVGERGYLGEEEVLLDEEPVDEDVYWRRARA